FWSEFLVDWYGRKPEEQTLLALLEFGPYVGAFAASLLLQFVLPFVLLIWNRIRVSIGGPVVAATCAVAGNFLLQVWLFVPAWAVAEPRWPDAADALIMIGWPAAEILAVLLALRVAPPISTWEY